MLFIIATKSQVILNRDSSVKKAILQRAPPTPIKNVPSLYTLTSARVNIRTGNDNKENGANMIFFFREKDGIWGKGADLFQGGSKAEFKVNTNVDVPLDKVSATPQASFTLDNLQAKGLYFA